MAAKSLAETGIPFSVSVMFPCPWYKEAVEILKQYQHISVGIHLTLNSEWKNYKWGPVSRMVPTLVDEDGYFFPSRETFNNNNPKLEEIELELKAQIERAINSGLKIDYLDYHMGTAVDKPEYRAIVEKLADEYKLGISRYFGEMDLNSMYSKNIEEKKDSLIKVVNEINANQINLLVCHIGMDNPELAAMIDLNTFGLKDMSRHRQSELNALISQEFRNALNDNKIRLITYRDLIETVQLINMKKPVVDY
jgi:predicted glycoside hydrolase/deacetylase ChbG (UPF0249 family)